MIVDTLVGFQSGLRRVSSRHIAIGPATLAVAVGAVAAWLGLMMRVRGEIGIRDLRGGRRARAELRVERQQRDAEGPVSRRAGHHRNIGSGAGCVKETGPGSGWRGEPTHDALVTRKKPFAFMSYPNCSRSISEGEGTELHLFTMMMEHFARHVMPDPETAGNVGFTELGGCRSRLKALLHFLFQ